MNGRELSCQDVAIVIPVYNDPDGIDETLTSVRSNVRNPIKIFVVDNGSTDQTDARIQHHVDKDERVHGLIEDEVQSSYAARNRGVESTDGEVVAFLDADESVEKDWLENALNAMEQQEVDYLGCNIDVTHSENSLVGRYNKRRGFPVEEYINEHNYAPTGALLVKKDVFEDIGLFDSRLVSGGDMEFGERVNEAGYEQGYADDAIVHHPARTSFLSLAKKNFRVGRGFCQKQSYYPERYGNPGIPPKPSGLNDSEDESSPDPSSFRLTFFFLSLMMLLSRGLGYYHEFFFGEKRNDIPAPTN